MDDPFTWRRVLVTVSMMLVAFLVAGAATAVVVGLDPGKESRTGADPVPRSPAASSPTSPSRTSTSPPSARPVGFDCWNGRRAPKLSACTPPTGPGGLEWVFPTFQQLKARGDCAPPGVTSEDRIGRLLFFDCGVVVDGKDVTYRFTWWRSAKQSRKHYIVDEYPPDKATWRDFTVKGSIAGVVYKLNAPRERDGKFRLSASYSNGLFSMTVESDQPGVIEPAFRKVEFRAVDRLRGRPAD